ncbi:MULTISPECIES: FAD-binding oxidoreductase [unclassified Bordetella]|uniref:FAD-binding oxidoreductase n=1 Tax=unclassified Bordetella TaxID=2630031 RepID=UPI0013245922|nr:MULTISPECIES: FAD-binding oxidoreductase [unclassified Bordetella]MVW71459.1 FAD-binding protein [Bordetella sp. 15P40C-2]MVW79324.1 FAD-binding protein [Bordetella sp. 02P26C-1]
MTTSDFSQRLIEALGPDTVFTAPDDIEPWLTDWRGLYKGQAQAVVRPRTTEEVAKCLALCQQAGVPVVPRGGNTGLCGGATPDGAPANVVLSLDRMNKVRSVDTIANTLVAEAGCILGNLRRVAEEANRMLPLSLAAEDSCQIGGNVSTNAGGVNVVRYGMTRELVLGIEAVLPTGEIFHGLRTLRKDNTGYDLKQLLIGAEGTLGVITAVALRLFPRNSVRSVVLAAVQSPQQALELAELVNDQCGPRLQAYEFFTGDCVDLVLAHAQGVQEPFAQRYPGYVLMELADTADEDALNALLENVMGAALERELCLDAAVSTSMAQLQALWKLREEISEAQRADGPHLKHDISLPIEQIPAFMESAEKRVREAYPDIRPFIFGHFGDGNLHYNLSRPAGAPREWAQQQGDAVTDIVLDEVNRYGGSISAEHGIGQLKRDHFLHSKDPLELRLMRDIKRLFDPAGILNPGKLL